MTPLKQCNWMKNFNINPILAARQKSRYWRMIWLLLLLVLLIWIWLQQEEGEDEIETDGVVTDETPEPPSPVSFPEQTEPDDLKQLKGIGPKIANILHSAGILTFDQLASTNAEKLEHILQDAGIRLANSDTWPEQARLAAAGDWEGLRELQSQI